MVRQPCLLFFLFFFSKLNQRGLYFLSKSIVTYLVVNALYYHACSIYDMSCRGRYRVRIDKNDECKPRNCAGNYFCRPWINQGYQIRCGSFCLSFMKLIG